jgi:hypothetical protein
MSRACWFCVLISHNNRGLASVRTLPAQVESKPVARQARRERAHQQWVSRRYRRRPCHPEHSSRSQPPVQHPIYFYNIQMKPLQHIKKTDEIFKTKHLKHLWKYLKTFKNHYKHIQHQDELLANIRMKHLKTLGTYTWHVFICNIQIYFCNIQINLQRMSGPDETFGTHTWNICV